MQIEERADQWAFLAKVLNMKAELSTGGGQPSSQNAKPSP